MSGSPVIEGCPVMNKCLIGFAALATLAAPAFAQDRLKTMPGYAQHQKMAPQIPGSAKLGNVSATWIEEGKAVEWRDRDGKRHVIEADGLLATCLQHEMDHLEGVLFIDHLSKLKRSMALRKLQKAKRLKDAG